MSRWLGVLVLALASTLDRPVSSADEDCSALDTGEQGSSGQMVRLGPDDWKSRRLPERGDLDAVLAKLDYRDELPIVQEIDLDGDGQAEILIRSPDARGCGNAGCPYVALSAGSVATIGEFFGYLAILDERINGYRVIQSFGRVRAGATALDTYVFDGKRYRSIARVVLESCGFELWRRHIRDSSPG